MLDFTWDAVSVLTLLSIITGIASAPIMERNQTRTWCEYIERMKTRWRLSLPFFFVFFMSSAVAIAIYQYYTAPHQI